MPRSLEFTELGSQEAHPALASEKHLPLQANLGLQERGAQETPLETSSGERLYTSLWVPAIWTFIFFILLFLLILFEKRFSV